MFVDKARILLLCVRPERCNIRVGSGKHLTRRVRDKNTSLLRIFVNYGRKKFYNNEPLIFVFFTSLRKRRPWKRSRPWKRRLPKRSRPWKRRLPKRSRSPKLRLRPSPSTTLNRPKCQKRRPKHRRKRRKFNLLRRPRSSPKPQRSRGRKCRSKRRKFSLLRWPRLPPKPRPSPSRKLRLKRRKFRPQPWPRMTRSLRSQKFRWKHRPRGPANFRPKHRSSESPKWKRRLSPKPRYLQGWWSRLDEELRRGVVSALYLFSSSSVAFRHK